MTANAAIHALEKQSKTPQKAASIGTQSDEPKAQCASMCTQTDELVDDIKMDTNKSNNKTNDNNESESLIEEEPTRKFLGIDCIAACEARIDESKNVETKKNELKAIETKIELILKHLKLGNYTQDEKLKESYATIVKKTSKKELLNIKKLKKNGANLLGPKKESADFERLHISVQDNRPLKECLHPGQLRNTMELAMEYIGIYDQVVAVSKIGTSIMEIYFPKETKEFVVNQLALSKVIIYNNLNIHCSPDFGPTKNFKEKRNHRLAYLLAKSKYVKLNRCILNGLGDDERIDVLSRAKII